jgi:hypothetical protein
MPLPDDALGYVGDRRDMVHGAPGSAGAMTPI